MSHRRHLNHTEVIEMRILITLVSLFWAFLLFMTGARFLILLLNIDRSNEIVDWIIRHSDYWVKPFFHLLHLSNKGIGTGGFIEWASLIAFIVYLVLGRIILNLLSRASWGGMRSWGRGRRWGWG